MQITNARGPAWTGDASARLSSLIVAS